MAEKTQADKFANQAVITVTESAANTLTFKKLETGVSLFEKVAWVIHRIEWFMNNFGPGTFNTSGDILLLALTVANNMTTIALDDPQVLDMLRVAREDYGTAASGIITHHPIVKDFSSLPGGGLIVPPNPLYAAAVGTGLAGATTSLVKLFYTTYPLAADDYWELVDSRRMIAS
jgi:hypothetical protein